MTYIVTIDWIWHARALWLNSSSFIVENMLILEGDVVSLAQGRGWRMEDIRRTGPGDVIRRTRKHAQIAKSHVCVYLFHVRIHFARAQTPTWPTTMYAAQGRIHVYTSQDESWGSLYNFSLIWTWSSFRQPCTPTNNSQAAAVWVPEREECEVELGYGIGREGRGKGRLENSEQELPGKHPTNFSFAGTSCAAPPISRHFGTSTSHQGRIR